MADGTPTKTALDVLAGWSACSKGLDEVREAGSMRAAWETSTSRANMMWLLGKLYVEGKLSRHRLVRVAIRCAETVAHKMPPDARPLLADVSAWTNGDTSVDLQATRAALMVIRQRAWTAYAAAAYAAYAADAYAAYAAYAAAAAAAAAYAAYAAYAAAADAAAAAADAAAADAAMCDVVRDEIDADEVCAAMGVA